jgi:hypothetical protein
MQVIMAAVDKPRNIQSKGSIGDIVTDTGETVGRAAVQPAAEDFLFCSASTTDM